MPSSSKSCTLGKEGKMYIEQYHARVNNDMCTWIVKSRNNVKLE